MKTVYDKTTRDELITRINTLGENSKAQWGKMTVYQMVKHCSRWEEMALGKRVYKQVFIGRLFGKMALRYFLKDGPIRHNSPTMPYLRITDNCVNPYPKFYNTYFPRSLVNFAPEIIVMNKKKVIGLSVFFFVLVFIFLFIVLSGVKTPGDIFKADTWSTFSDGFKSKSPELNTVKPFAFTTQDGKPFTDKDMLGKVCVVNYFFTSCRGICPRMNNNMQKAVYDVFKDEPDFMIVSNTCDPETDSASRLKHYADSLKVDENKWVFLTGRKDSLYQAARNSYLLDDPKNSLVNINDQFLHTQFFALVDKNGKVRGQIYDGLKQDELKQLQTDIKALLREKATSANF